MPTHAASGDELIGVITAAEARVSHPYARPTTCPPFRGPQNGHSRAQWDATLFVNYPSLLSNGYGRRKCRNHTNKSPSSIIWLP